MFYHSHSKGLQTLGEARQVNVRISPELHAAIATAAADGKSLNQWVSDELRACVAGSG